MGRAHCPTVLSQLQASVHWQLLELRLLTLPGKGEWFCSRLLLRNIRFSQLEAVCLGQDQPHGWHSYMAFCSPGMNYLGILLCHSSPLGLGSVRFSVCALYITTEARPFTGP